MATRQGNPEGNRQLTKDRELPRSYGAVRDLAPRDRGDEYGHVAGTSISGRRTDLIPSPRERQALRRRVGAFIRERRKELGLSSGDIVRALGYKHLASVWKLEKGLEGLPTKRVYAWADILQVPRDAFFRFVTGETERMEMSPGPKRSDVGPLTAAESELIETYRELPQKYQRRLREQAGEYRALTATAGRGRR